MGYEGSSKQVFRWLLPENGRKHIVINDLEALLIGVSTSERSKVWEGEKQAVPNVSRKPMEIKSLEGFKKLLIRHFGSIYAGWRKGLDSDGSGVVTKSNFAKGCRAMGFMGHINGLWRLLDENKN